MSRGSYGIWQPVSGNRGTKSTLLFERDDDDDSLMLQSSTLREAAFYRAVQHSNIAQCYKIEMSRSKVIMELERGDMDLDQFIRESGYTKRKKWFNKIFVGLLHALEFIHRGGILHGDLKPKNVILTKTYDAKLIDFGGSQIKYRGKYERGMTTFLFMSPEDALYDVYGPSNDIWSLGLVLLYYFEQQYRSMGWSDKTDAKEWFRTHTKIDMTQVKAPPFIKTLLEKILVWDHTKRPTAAELIAMLDPEKRYVSSGYFRFDHVDQKNTLANYYVQKLKYDSKLIRHICELLELSALNPWHDDIYVDDICYKIYNTSNGKLRDCVRATICWILETLGFDLWVQPC